MSSKTFRYEPLRPGFAWSLTLNVTSDPALFPAGAKLRADVWPVARDPLNPGRALALLTTENGTLVRVDDHRLTIDIPARVSRNWQEGKVELDLVRTDLSEPKHLGIRLRFEVKKSITAAG